jgi:MinD-like ATPase involved in chromosome partitioning or flagellar assembly
MSARPSVVAFQSDRPGIGQSMIMATVAWLLAANGRRVLAIDWDLAKPSLTKYYTPFIERDIMFRNQGVIDFVWEYGIAARRAGVEDKDLRDRIAEVMPLSCSVPPDLALRPAGVLDVIPAGGKSRAVRVQYFSWREFTDRLDGTAALTSLFDRFISQYDHVLVDCAAGPAIDATVFPLLRADVLVPCFTLDHESIEATAVLARWVVDRSSRRKLQVYPVPLRIQLGEKRLQLAALEFSCKAYACVSQSLGIPDGDLDVFWGEVMVPEVPYFIYERILPPLVDDPDHFSLSVTASCCRLASAITGQGEIQWRSPSAARIEKFVADSRIEETDAKNATRLFPLPFAGESPYTFVSYARDDRDLVLPILQGLVELEFRLWWDDGIPGGADWNVYLAQKIQNCQCMLIFRTNRSAHSHYVAEEIRIAHEAGKPLLGIRLDWTEFPSEAERILARYQMLDVAVEDFHERLAQSMYLLTACAGTITEGDAE